MALKVYLTNASSRSRWRHAELEYDNKAITGVPGNKIWTPWGKLIFVHGPFVTGWMPQHSMTLRDGPELPGGDMQTKELYEKVVLESKSIKVRIDFPENTLSILPLESSLGDNKTKQVILYKDEVIPFIDRITPAGLLAKGYDPRIAKLSPTIEMQPAVKVTITASKLPSSHDPYVWIINRLEPTEQTYEIILKILNHPRDERSKVNVKEFLVELDKYIKHQQKLK